MGRKKKIAEEPKTEVKSEVKVFEYGDLAVVCKCGRTQIIQKGIDKGLQLILTTREDSYIQLRCDECESDIRLCFLEGVKPEPEIKPVEVTEEAVVNTEKVNEVVQEESKQESSL